MKLFKNLNFNKLKEGLAKTKDKLINRITETISGKAKLDEEVLEELEEVLITSDMGYDTAHLVIEEVRRRLTAESDRSEAKIIGLVKQVLVEVLEKSSSSAEYTPDLEKKKPFVLLIVGINGAGKTTTVGKLAHNFKQSGLSVIVGAADTFRAAANEQLDVWAKRAGVDIVSKGQGADPSSVVFETLSIAVKQNTDVVMIDTAGRLHTKTNLMEELNKIRRVIAKQVPGAPHETFLVLDGNTGQNAIQQMQEFSKVTDISGLIVTKLDGTAKGGAVFQICSRQNIPIRYIGVGEAMEDLQTFDPRQFTEALFS